MFKKILITLCLLAFLGCATMPTTPTIKEVVKEEVPAWITHLSTRPGISIVDYRDDGVTLWLWIDNFKMPDQCDYVVVLGYTGGTNAQTGLPTVRVLTVYNKQMSPTPCEVSYYKYEEYLSEMKKSGAYNE